LFPIPDPPSWMMDWFTNHTGIIVLCYVVILSVIYLFTLIRVLTRVFNSDRSASYNYALIYPAVLLMAAPVMDVTNTTFWAITSNHVRFSTTLIWFLYVLAFNYWRREGERIRALPRDSNSAPERQE
jgi:hypothetical protein